MHGAPLGSQVQIFDRKNLLDKIIYINIIDSIL